MHQRVIQIENEIEWLQVQRILERNDIPFMSNQVQNTAFPDLNTHKKYHQIVIPDECSEQYFNLIEGGYPNKILHNDKRVDNSKIWPYLMIIYGLVMTLLFFKYFQIVQRSSSQKNFVSEWTFDNKKLKSINKKSGITEYIYIDGNFDNNFEKIEEYIGSRKISTSFDKDENGRIEETLYFSIQGEFAGRSSDTNQDKFTDTLTMVLENQEKLILVDKNSNGFFEMVE